MVFFISNWCGFSLLCLITVISTVTTMLNKSGEIGHLCLISEFSRKSYRFSRLNMMLAIGFSYMALIMLEYILSSPFWWELLSYVDVEYFQLLFMHWLNWSYICIYICIYIKSFICKCDIAHLLADVEPSLNSWNKSHLIMVYDPFNVLLNLVCWYFVEDFFVYVHQRYSPVKFLFLWWWCPFLVLISELHWLCKMNMEVFPSLMCFWKSLIWIDINYLNVW